MTESILESLDIQYIDHLAVTTSDLDGTLEAYLRLPGTRLLRGPGNNPGQGVQFAFVRLADGWTLEILAPSPTTQSPITTHLANGGGAYHFCYAVNAIDTSISAALAHGARLVEEPKADVAFDGRRVAFLYHALTGLFELVEAFPSSPARASRAGESATPRPTRSAPLTQASRQSKPADFDQRLAAIFAKQFPNTPATEIRSLKQGGISEWSSLGHLMLIMELEREFAVAIPASAVARLDSYAAFHAFLGELV